MTAFSISLTKEPRSADQPVACRASAASNRVAQLDSFVDRRISVGIASDGQRFGRFGSFAVSALRHDIVKGKLSAFEPRRAPGAASPMVSQPP